MASMQGKPYFLPKKGPSSISSFNDYGVRSYRKTGGSVSTISATDEPGYSRQPRYENTFQMGPTKVFPSECIENLIKNVLTSYLASEHYQPELCRELTKTLSEVVKARVKDLAIPRYKFVCVVTIGQLINQDVRIISRCLWDESCDSFSTYKYTNSSLYATCTVYGIYRE